MKSCLEWRRSCRFLSEVDQFNIDFKDKKQQLIKFLDIFAITQRVNIRIPNNLSENQIELLIALGESQKYNIAICFIRKYSYQNEQIFNNFKSHNIPCYFYNLIDNWDELTGYCSIGVSDIFVTGELGFDLERAAAATHKNNVRIRCYVNMCQSRWLKDTTGLKTFFIRPEDLQIYNDYIDVIQFSLRDEDLQQQDILYQIYFKDNKWDGDLKEIIQGLKVSLNSYYLLGNEFGKRRLNCQKRCLKGNSRCNFCETIKNLADTIENSPILEVYERKK